MTPDEIAAMQADALAGTPGDWAVKQMRGHSVDYIVTDHPDFQQTPHGNYVAETGIAAGHVKQRFEPDARRIARVPRMEATITAQAAEIARLREALKPFAFEIYADAMSDDRNILTPQLTIGDFRRARAALVQP